MNAPIFLNPVKSYDQEMLILKLQEEVTREEMKEVSVKT